MLEKSIQTVLKDHSGRLLELPGVVGVGQGQHGRTSYINVYVTRKNPELLSRIPPTLEGYPVIVEEVGEFRAAGRR